MDLLSLPLESPTLRDEQNNCISNHYISTLSARERRLVCVTSGNSRLGSHLVKKLLARGYLVRVTIQNPADFEDMKLLSRYEEMNMLESVVVAKIENLESLCEAFRGCDAIFHTSSFIDPHGVTGYSETMSFVEMEGAKNVIEACARSARVKRCIFTSSLLACIWNNNTFERVVIDESCWSDEDFCRENKLWLALGKTRAEKAAWGKSMELKVKLVTLCPGLFMVPSFPNPHIETSLPYLKGGQVMLQRGLLATEDVGKLADKHVHIYEAMDYGACGRYLCFDRVVNKLSEAIQLEDALKMPQLLSGFRNSDTNNPYEEVTNEFSSTLLNCKITKLLFQVSQRTSCKEDEYR